MEVNGRPRSFGPARFSLTMTLNSINPQAAKHFSLNKSTLEAEVASKIIITDSIIMTPALCLMLRLCHCLKLCGQKVSITGVSLRVCLLIL